MTGQKAHYALCVKYGKEGKPVPQYDWADPTDYGDEGVPTPVVDAGGNVGLLRDAMPKRLSKQQKAILWEQFNEKEALRYKKDGTIGSRNVINSDKVGLVYDRTEDDKFEERELFNIEADPGRLTAFQKELKNGIKQTGEAFSERAEEFGVWNGDDSKGLGGTSDREAREGDDEVDGVAYQNLRRLSATPSLPEGAQDNPTGYSNGSGVGKVTGSLREAAPLDEHLQALCEAMPIEEDC